MNFLKAATIPAILTVLFTATGWFFDRSVQRFETVSFLRYSASSQMVADRLDYTLEIENQSAAQNITDILILVQCQDNSSCFVKREDATEINRNMTYVPVPPLAVVPLINDDSRDSFSEFRVAALPIGAKAQFRYHLTSAVDTPVVLFKFSDDLVGRVSAFTGWSTAAWAASHYQSVLLVIVCVLGLAIVIYFGWLVFSAKGEKRDEKPQAYRLIHSLDDNSRRVAGDTGAGGSG